MENNKQNCSCDSGCCQPQKSNTLTRLIFIIVIVAALAIVGFKMVNNKDSRQQGNQGNPAACDTTAGCNDSTANSSCCPKKAQ